MEVHFLLRIHEESNKPIHVWYKLYHNEFIPHHYDESSNLNKSDCHHIIKAKYQSMHEKLGLTTQSIIQHINKGMIYIQ